MNQNGVTINIRQLVLDGFSDIDRVQLQLAIRQQLQQRVSQQRMFTNAQDRHMVFVSGGQFSVDKSITMDMLGDQIAGAIHDSLNRVNR